MTTDEASKATNRSKHELLYLDFTGISAPYEAPLNPEVHIRTDQVSIEEGVQVRKSCMIDLILPVSQWRVL